MRQYTQEEVKHAFHEMIKDEKALDAIWQDFKKILADHVLAWLENQPIQKDYGKVVTSKGRSRLLCPRCNYLNTMDSNYCTQCSNQLQDTWLEKTRKKNLGIND